MKTAPRPYRRGVKLRRSARLPKRSKTPPENLPPPPSFTVQNFKDGRSITYTLTREGYVFQVSGDEPVATGASSYPAAAAKARARYGLPAIGSASYQTFGLING